MWSLCVIGDGGDDDDDDDPDCEEEVVDGMKKSPRASTSWRRENSNVSMVPFG